jgi:hypothetical protein
VGEKKFIQILSLMALYDRKNEWHIFMALRVYIPKKANKQYVSQKKHRTLLGRVVVTVKEYGQIEGKLRSFYDPEKSDKLVMFIIRHLFCAITCNKLIISVTLVLNYIPNDEGEREREEALLQIAIAEFL